MFSIKPGPRNLPIDNPTLLSWNITDGDLNSKLNTLEYLNCITNIINSCGVYPQDLKDREIISTFHAEKVINNLLKNNYKISLFPDTTYRELNKAAQRSITAPDRIGEEKHGFINEIQWLKEVITAVFISMVQLNILLTLYLTNRPQKISMLHMLLTFLTMNWQLMYIILT